MPIEDVVEVSPAPSAPGGRRRLLGIGAVVAVLVAGGGVATWAATRGSGSDAGITPVVVAALCPQSMPAPWDSTGGRPEVPHEPTASGTAGRLVPERDPLSVLVCEYEPAASTGVSAPYVAPTDGGGSGVDVATPAPAVVTPIPAYLTLTRSAANYLGADVGPLMSALQDATVRPSAGVDCAVDWAELPTTHVVQLTYDDGVVWIVTPDRCAGITNGDSHGEVDIRSQVTAALDSAPDTPVSSSPEPASSSPFYSAPPQPLPGGSASGGSTGDPGTGVASGGGVNPDPVDDPLAACVVDLPANTASVDRFVPFTPTSVRICTSSVDPTSGPAKPVDHPANVASDLVAELGTLPVLAPDTACTAIGGQVWALVFTGAGGQQELVTVDAGGCGTASNGPRTVQADDELYSTLRTLV